ncbi:hypothetical protein ACFPOI_11725 [Nonomuraea angiospora]|uniref:Uncharacterized protein n=1 Tax=Nonomuraea angiospora TaxID=46172 RepID=A0ABR9MFB0_9ACTN|nr:hypothetical protein [Nonomuraea angiospora]MBE1591192.1 hypothetical protein [Nonomuraea angiospora]
MSPLEAHGRSPLEARYRRLLACYPRDHQERHEEEMIGVLLAGARPGQTRPHPADAADLLWGALRVHARRAFGAGSAPSWRDGVALAVALWPLLMLTAALAKALVNGVPTLETAWNYGVVVLTGPATTRHLVQPIAIAAVLALAVLSGRKWVAALGAVMLVVGMADPWSGMIPGLDIRSVPSGRVLLVELATPNVGPVLVAHVAAAVIAFIPAAHRALRAIPRRTLLLWAPLALVGLTASKALVRWVDVTAHHDVVVWKPVPWLVVVSLAAGVACRSALGRRAALVLFLPAAALGDLGDLLWIPTSTALAQLGCAALAFAAGAALSRRRGGLAALAPTP